MQGKTILIVDDDLKLRGLLSQYLAGYGLKVHTLPDGSQLEPTLRQNQPDLLILDVMMPGRDGLDLLADLRAEFSLPVIMLTAKGEEADRIVGLELGADDYLPKPFSPRELLARIKAVLRRWEAAKDAPVEQPEFLEVAGLRLDLGRRRLLVEKQEVELSATEFRILQALMARPDVVFSRERLLVIARGRQATAFDRAIDVHISNLRAKLKPYARHEQRIRTVWGSGYLLRGEP